MKQSRSALLVIVFVLAALALTATGGCEMPGEAEEFRDPGTLIMVEKGDEFAIVLESNPTTGYQWELADELDEEIVHLVKTEYIEPDTELMGAAGEEKLTFKAEGLGNTTITLAYIRPWEEEEPEEPVVEGTEGEEGAEGETEESEEAHETEEGTEEEPTTVTFNVRVRKAGSMDKDPKKYDKDAEQPIEVEAGLEFALVLESNPTTGYSWQLAEPLDEDVVELVSSEFEKKTPEESEGEIVGAPGEEVWTFEAIAEGETEITLEYVRPWETDVAPEETVTFEVKVTPVPEEAEE